MQYRSLGHAGLKVSAIGLGTNQFGGKVDQQTVNDILAAAQANVDSLADYGITQAKLTALKKKIDAFEAVLGKPREAITTS
ncbi:MAG TPA: hypothetical protein PK530_04855, partial [Anaerolineales bacterium]|nr:hypothetical protein [Anaerolineales bacterium]